MSIIGLRCLACLGASISAERLGQLWLSSYLDSVCFFSRRRDIQPIFEQLLVTVLLVSRYFVTDLDLIHINIRRYIYWRKRGMPSHTLIEEIDDSLEQYSVSQLYDELLRRHAQNAKSLLASTFAHLNKETQFFKDPEASKVLARLLRDVNGSAAKKTPISSPAKPSSVFEAVSCFITGWSCLNWLIANMASELLRVWSKSRMEGFKARASHRPHKSRYAKEQSPKSECLNRTTFSISQLWSWVWRFSSVYVLKLTEASPMMIPKISLTSTILLLLDQLICKFIVSLSSLRLTPRHYISVHKKTE